MQVYNITVKRGDTFAGVKFQYKQNGVPIDLEGAIVLMQVREEPDSNTTIMQFSSEAGEIIIGGGDNNELTIMPKIIPSGAPARKCCYDVQITFPNGSVKTWVSGYFEILKDVSR